MDHQYIQLGICKLVHDLLANILRLIHKRLDTDLHIYFECKLYPTDNPMKVHTLGDILRTDFQNNLEYSGTHQHHYDEYILHLLRMDLVRMD